MIVKFTIFLTVLFLVGCGGSGSTAIEQSNKPANNTTENSNVENETDHKIIQELEGNEQVNEGKYKEEEIQQLKHSDKDEEKFNNEIIKQLEDSDK